MVTTRATYIHTYIIYSIKYLEICYHTYVAVEYIKQRLPMLQYLDIGSNSIGDDGLRNIT